MHSPVSLQEFVGNFLVIVAASVAVLLISHRLRLSPIIGFLVTGMVIGPSGLGLIGQHEVEVFAEIGVVLLLFTVGLEFSLAHLRARWRPFLIGGGLQVGLTIALTLVVAMAAGASWRGGVFLGCLAALSSTAIVLKAYADRRELQSPQGTLVTAILLFQDVCLAPMIVLTPLLAGNAEASPFAVLGRVAVGSLLVCAAFVLARLVVPRLLHWIVRTRVREVFVLTALGACLGLGMLTERLGFSMALGAFLAGLVLSETEYRHQVAAEVLPFRDLLNGLFFISLGMLLRFDVVRSHALAVLGIAVVLVIGKSVVAAVAVAILGYPARVALVTGWSLAQVGEFSFVLGGVGLAGGVLDATVYQAFIAASIGTMLVAPLWIHWAPKWSTQWQVSPMLRALERLRRDAPAAAAVAEEAAPQDGHVVLVGYGLNGRNVARVLRETAIPFVVLEMNPTLVREARATGVRVVYGDAARAEVLGACGIETAGMVVLAISDQAATRQAVRVARRANPGVAILARTRAVEEIDELLRLGADEVIPEEFETSIEIFCRVLERYHVPRNVIDAQVRIIRDEGYGMLRDAARPAAAALDRLTAILEGTLTETFNVRPGSRADGATLREMDLRHATGASVIALVRAGVPTTNPGAEMRLQAFDTLVLVGDHAALEAAGRALSEAADSTRGG
jgi:CPA2 family monovalent cation:H+ antiporter-2